MKVTARMIADKLNNRLVSFKMPDEAKQGYEFIRVLLPETQLVEEDQAYIVPAGQLPELASPAQSCLIITQEPVDLAWPCAVLFCHGTVHEIYEDVLRIFAQYAALENELREGLLNDWDLSRMLAPLARFFANSIQVYAPIFKAVASVKPLISPDGIVTGTTNYEQNISAQIVHGMLRSKDLREDIKSGIANYRRYPVFDCGCYQVNLLNHDQLVGRLVLIEEFSPFTIGVADTLNEAAKYIRHMMIHRRSPVNASLFTVEYSITEILSGRITDSQVIEALMSTFARPGQDLFNIIYFCLDEIDIPTQDIISFHVQALGDLLPQAVVLPLDDGIVALCRSKSLTARIFEDSLEPYLSSTEIFAGLGESFSDFYAARTCYLQARAAVRLGIESPESGHIFNYKDNAVDHLVNVVVESGYGITFVHPGIEQLALHDQLNQTELLATLRTYLESQCNQVATAEKLHIHRNSLKYRLQQIADIMGVDLRGTNQHLRWLLSILIRERLLRI